MRIAFWRQDRPQPEQEVHEEDATYEALRRIPVGDLEERLGWWTGAIKRRIGMILRGINPSSMYMFTTTDIYVSFLERQEDYFSGTGWTLESYISEIDKELKVGITEEKRHNRIQRMLKGPFLFFAVLTNVTSLSRLFWPALVSPTLLITILVLFCISAVFMFVAQHRERG